MPDFDPKHNYSFVTPITCANGTHFLAVNFTQESPWTEPFSATGLTFEDCNLCNCLLPADATVIVGGKAKTLPTLTDGRLVGSQNQYRVETEEVEQEPGVYVDHEIQKRYKVTGTPAAPVETLLDTVDLGPT